MDTILPVVGAAMSLDPPGAVAIVAIRGFK